MIYQQSDLIITSGFDALIKYEKFLRKKREKISRFAENLQFLPITAGNVT